MIALTSSRTTKHEHTKAGIRLRAQRDLFDLSKNLLGYADMTEAFHQPLLHWSQHNPTRKKLHLAARGTFKSSGVDIAKTVQYILNQPTHCTLLGSNKAENAQKFLSEIEGHLKNEVLVWAFPDILWQTPREQSENYLKGAATVKRPKGLRPRKEATIETNGVEGELVSTHFERGVFDDLVAKENSQTRPERQKVIAWYEAAQALVDVPTPELAWVDIINTPWDYDDLIAVLLKKKLRGDIKLAVYQMPCWVPDAAGIEVPGRGRLRATFPEKLSIPTLLALRKEMPLHFAAQYELTPADQDTAVFKRIQPDDKHPYGIPVVKPRREQPPLSQLWLAITIDPAISVKGWADNSALTVCGWDHENNQHVLWLKWGKWSETQLIEETYLAYNRFAAQGNTPAVVGFEAIAFQRLYLHLFRQAGETRGFLPITKLERDTKNTKQTRQLVLEPGWNSGGVILYDDLDALDDLLDMASKFRAHKELTRDDLLDVLADNHQLRIRPNAPETEQDRAMAALEPQEQEKVRYMLDVQARREAEGRQALDEPSLHMAWLTHKTRTEQEHAARDQALGIVENELFVESAPWL